MLKREHGRVGLHQETGVLEVAGSNLRFYIISFQLSPKETHLSPQGVESRIGPKGPLRDWYQIPRNAEQWRKSRNSVCSYRVKHPMDPHLAQMTEFLIVQLTRSDINPKLVILLL